MNIENKSPDENDKFFMLNALELKKEFFKSIFYLSTGMLALSITLTQANPTQESINTTFLFCSWILLGITTGFVLLFYLISDWCTSISFVGGFIFIMLFVQNLIL